MDIKVQGTVRRVKLTKTERGYFEKVRDICAVIASNAHGNLSEATDECADSAAKVLMLLDGQETKSESKQPAATK